MPLEIQRNPCVTVKTGHHRFDLYALILKAGTDWIVAILGGESPHIGAVAIGQPRQSLRDCSSSSASSSVFCVLGHKEDLIAKEIAESLAAIIGETTVVTAGMHWHDLKEDEIKFVLSKTEKLKDLILEAITRMKDTTHSS